MKYIRTKDGIIDLSKVTIGENGWKNIEEYIAFKQEEQKELIKQANTIEELCDYWDFYFISDKEYLVRSIKDYTTKQIKNMLDGKYIVDIKLAIRTNKGLKYVSKMNNKGELELL